jgi:hypothetical protein
MKVYDRKANSHMDLESVVSIQLTVDGFMPRVAVLSMLGRLQESSSVLSKGISYAFPDRLLFFSSITVKRCKDSTGMIR